jgi:hypothetical protein
MAIEKNTPQSNGLLKPSNLIEKSLKPPAPTNLKPPPAPPKVVPGQSSKRD